MEALESVEILLTKRAINEAVDALHRIGKFLSGWEYRDLVSRLGMLTAYNPHVDDDRSPLLIVNLPLEGPREEAVKVKEVAILKLGEVLAKHGFADSTLRVIENGLTYVASMHGLAITCAVTWC